MSTSDFLPARDDQKLPPGAWSRTYTLSGITIVDNTTWHARIVRNKGDVQSTGTLVSPTVTVDTGANTVTFSLTATQVATLIGAGAAKFPGYWSVYYDTLATELVAGSFVIDRTATNSGSAGATTLTYSPTTGSTLTVTAAISPESGATILAKLLTVDGSGSGLDADTVDGQHATAFDTAGAAVAMAIVLGGN